MLCLRAAGFSSPASERRGLSSPVFVMKTENAGNHDATGGNMQQYPGDWAPRPVRAPRTQPMLPGTTSSIAPTLVPAQKNMLSPPGKKRPDHVRQATLKLLALGVALEGLYLALYPLLASTNTKNAAAGQALLAARVGNQITRERFPDAHTRIIFLTI